MPHLAFELDAKRKVPLSAKRAGITAAQFAWGLLELWESCWREKTDQVTAEVIGLLFDGEPEKVIAGLVLGGFAEEAGDHVRVRGADRYLRITESRAEGARKTNAKRWKKDEASDKPATAERRSPVAQASLPGRSAVAPVSLKSDAERSLPVALTPNTEHRAPNTSTTQQEPPPEQDGGPGFFAKANDQRAEVHGLAPEKPTTRHVEKVGRWYGPALAEFEGDEAWMLSAHRRFLADPYWAKADPPWPFAAFAKTPTKWAGAKPVPVRTCDVEGCQEVACASFWGRWLCYAAHLPEAQRGAAEPQEAGAA